jgi:DNA-binding MarR family transcriptional regulator
MSILSEVKPGDLCCACANLRRAARAVTRLYDQELRASGLKATQFTLLMALHTAGNITQGQLGEILALDSTTLTRTLRILLRQGAITALTGHDRRERYLRLTAEGRKRFLRARPDWQRAQRRLKSSLGQPEWQQLGEILAQVTRAAL